jgi:hypothetical protein
VGRLVAPGVRLSFLLSQRFVRVRFSSRGQASGGELSGERSLPLLWQHEISADCNKET